MNIKERLRKLIPQLDPSDGSQDVARAFIDDLDNEEEMHGLLQNSAFKKILDRMRVDFTKRIDELVKKDPELKEMRKMFVRTVGTKNTADRVKQYVEKYIDSPEE